MKILMVCLGNICRSPLAEGIMKEIVQREGIDWEIDSAGTGAWHAGETPDPRSVEVSRRNGIHIADQRARQFTAEDFSVFDYILAMDASNFRDILKLAPTEDARQKVEMIMNYAYPGENRRVPDPYYGGPSGFDDVFELLTHGCEAVLRQLK
ncbi:MAG: low molecular weight phosphotyrosine protein phosphatase [Saprospiraceae bacterium]|nr:low molecular weight phosphotyrosine protein phosphatase [Saprospiraceae bacterium]